MMIARMLTSVSTREEVGGLRSYNPPPHGAPSRRPAAVLPGARGAGPRALARARRLPRVGPPPSRARRRGSSTRGRRPPTAGPAPITSSRASSRTSSRATRRCAATASPRKGGWDTHGLPVEIEVEQQLGIDGKQRDRGVRHRRVQPALPRGGLRRYLEEWERADRAHRLLGRPRRRLLHVRRDATSSRSGGSCGRSATRGCSTRATRSCPTARAAAPRCRSHEVAQGYEDVIDPRVYVRLPVVEDGGPVQAGDELLVWTTTPWTLVSQRGGRRRPRAHLRARARPGDSTHRRARRGARRARARHEGVQVLDRVPGRGARRRALRGCPSRI